MLVTWEVGVVESDFSAGDHSDLNTVIVREPGEEFLEGLGSLLDNDLVVVGVAFGQHGDRSAHNGVELLGLVLDDIVWLTHHD